MSPRIKRIRKDIEGRVLPLTVTVMLVLVSISTFFVVMNDTVKAAPVEITTIEGLYAIRDDLDGDYLLMNDLDFNDNDSYEGTGEQKNTKRLDNTTGDGWAGISIDSDNRFNGTFDGQNYTISNLYMNHTDTGGRYGFFRYTNSGAVISNLILENVNVTESGDRIGGFVGSNDGLIYNCHVTGNVQNQAGTQYLGMGGFAGYHFGIIRNCSFNGNVSGYNKIGGFVGSPGANSDTEMCYSNGTVKAEIGRGGGFVGEHYGYINNSYSHCIVNRTAGSSTSMGGFCGEVKSGGSISKSYSTGSVEYGNDADPTNRGFIGITGGTNTSNLYDNDTSGQTSSGCNAVGKNTVDMQTLSTFTDAGWDIVAVGSYTDEVWYIDEGSDYPRLGWEYEELAITEFTLYGLTGTNITWAGMPGQSVWCNSSGAGHETLRIFIQCNESINVTDVVVWLDDMTNNGDTLLAGTVTLYVSGNNGTFGSAGTFVNGGSNITLNSAMWNVTSMGLNPFPVDPSSSTYIYARFLLAIPSSGVPDATYTNNGFKVYINGYDQ